MTDAPTPDEAAPTSPPGVPHDPTGLELADLIARGAKGGPPRSRAKRREQFDAQLSGARPDFRDPQAAGALLGRLVDDRGWATEMGVHVLLGRWDDIVGPEIAAHAQPEFADGVLVVRCDSTAWATQLRMIAPRLLAKLNESLKDAEVTRIEVKGPDAPSWKKGRRSVQGRGPRDTYG